jgi:1-aminocyclopropane-1-carboxylate deaminase
MKNRKSDLTTTFGVALPSPMHPMYLPAQLHFNQTQANTKADEISIWCKRDDLVHPIISGNKWRKLLQPVRSLQNENITKVISFGGPYSNHLHALAYCCYEMKVKLTAVVRGEYLANKQLNATLSDLQRWGAELHFVSKVEYKQRNEPDYLHGLKYQFKADIIIPEGGSQQDALFGIADMMEEVRKQTTNIFDTIFLPVASGATMAGVIAANDEQASQEFVAQNVCGIGVLKGEGYLEALVSQFLPPSKPEYANESGLQTKWSICHDYHFGGYARSNKALDEFCRQRNKTNSDADSSLIASLQIEPCYSGKLFYAVNDLIARGKIEKGSKLLLLHTGGLQGARTK